MKLLLPTPCLRKLEHRNWIRIRSRSWTQHCAPIKSVPQGHQERTLRVSWRSRPTWTRQLEPISFKSKPQNLYFGFLRCCHWSLVRDIYPRPICRTHSSVVQCNVWVVWCLPDLGILYTIICWLSTESCTSRSYLPWHTVSKWEFSLSKRKICKYKYI